MIRTAWDGSRPLERRVFFDQLASRYDVLRADPNAWSEIQAERGPR
jgi:hypothetical protein